MPPPPSTSSSSEPSPPRSTPPPTMTTTKPKPAQPKSSSSPGFFSFITARISYKGCRRLGYMRIVFALICIVDRLMLYPDYEFFFHPNHGMLPVNIDDDNPINSNDQTCSSGNTDGSDNGTCDNTPVITTTLLEQQLSRINLLSLMQYTTTMDQRWMLFWFGLLNIIFVLIGILPRLNLVLWHINYCSIMYNSSDYFPDGTETGIVPLMKLMNFYFFMLLPLDNITIWDGFGFNNYRSRQQQKLQKLQEDQHTNTDNNEAKKHIVDPEDDDTETSTTSTTTTTTTWPMWPIFLVQWQTVLIMVGAGLAKWTGDDPEHPISSSHWVDGTSMYYIMFGCPDECTGLIKYPDFIFDRVIVIKLMTWSALFVETIGPCLIWFHKTRIPCFVALVVLHISIDLTMSMHTFQPLMVLMWCSFLIKPIPQTTEDKLSSSSSPMATTATTTTTTSTNVLRRNVRVTPKWRRPVDLTIFFAMLSLIFSMAFPTNELTTILESYHFPWIFQCYNFVDWHNLMTGNYLTPFTQLLGIYQGPWCLFTGSFEGTSPVMEVNAATANGTIIFQYWSTPDWANLPRLEHKLRFNHINVYKHMSDCRGCDEQIILMQSLVNEILESSNPDNIVRMNLYYEVIHPPLLPDDWDDGLSWFDPIRQPLAYAAGDFEIGVVICHDELDNGCDDKEERFKFYFDETSPVSFKRWKTKTQQ